jgi:regulator of sigma E protease
LASILNNAYAIILVALGLGFVVFIHELGHFVMAKWAGVKVEMFSLGFGPTLVSWRKGFGFRLGSSVKDYDKKMGAPEEVASVKYGETEYQIRALPLGGFVLMLGEEGNDESGKTTDPRAFGNKPVGARMAIISAGVIMNVIFGVLCATWVFAKGKPERPAIVGGVVAGQPAYEAGIRAGDEVVAIDGRTGDLSYDDLAQASQFSGAGQVLQLGLKRHGSGDLIHVSVEPKRVGKAPAPTIGVYSGQSLDLAGQAPPGLVSDEENFDRVVAAGPEGAKPSPVEDAQGLYAILVRNRDRPVTIVADRGPAGEDRERGKAKTSRVQAVVPPRRFVDLGLRMTPGPIVALRPDSPAVRAGFRKGDQIVSVDGQADFDPMRLPDFAYDHAGKPVAFEVLREGKPLTISATPDDSPIWSEPMGSDLTSGSEPLEVPGLGLALEVVPKVAAVAPGSPADKAKIVVGDVVTAIRFANPRPKDAPANAPVSWRKPAPLDGKVAAWPWTFEALQNVEGPVRLDLARSASVVLSPAPVDGWFDPSHGLHFGTLYRLRPPEALLPALRDGIRETKDMALSIFTLIRSLVQGRLGGDSFGGPIPIANIGFKIARHGGFEALLPFLGMLSVNLAVFNFLPIPPLDGGQMVFLVAEKIRGRPLPESAVLYPKLAGLAFVLLLFVAVFLKDIISLF